jgi:hypothetical protein
MAQATALSGACLPDRPTKYFNAALSSARLPLQSASRWPSRSLSCRRCGNLRANRTMPMFWLPGLAFSPSVVRCPHRGGPRCSPRPSFSASLRVRLEKPTLPQRHDAFLIARAQLARETIADDNQVLPRKVAFPLALHGQGQASLTHRHAHE